MKIKTILAASLLAAALGASAHDFSATIDGQRLYFEITNKVKKTAAVTYCGSIKDKKENPVAGKVEIPAKVKHDNVVYDITAINPKAFAGAAHLKGIVMPAGIETVGDFAFEGCDSLASIVFPSNAVTFGQGVFFKCGAIADVTLGSDWKAVDLTMFRWSNCLEDITIPARIEKIHGVKMLKHLKSITVDRNNDKFSSDAGMLYSKDGSTLFACPRAAAGRVSVKEGTAIVTPGALIDCTEVTAIDLPASLKEFSFRETSRMKNLVTVVMRAPAPIFTAYDSAGAGRFLLQLDNPKVLIVVPSAAKKAYEEALAASPGEYSVTPGGEAYSVDAQQMPGKKNLKGVKNFDKY